MAFLFLLLTTLNGTVGKNIGGDSMNDAQMKLFAKKSRTFSKPREFIGVGAERVRLEKLELWRSFQRLLFTFHEFYSNFIVF